MADREPIAWVTRGGKHIPIFVDEPSEDEKKKDRDIEANKKQAEEKNRNIDDKVVSKFPKKIQGKVTFAEKDSSGKYHIVVNDEKYGEASFHDKNFSNMKWEINEFLKDGSRF